MILTEKAFRRLDGGEGTLSCVVGRELCLFMRIDASNVPVNQRLDLVRLSVRRAAPFGDPEFGMASAANGRIAVWYWSQARVAERLLAEGVHARRAKFLPEALLVRGDTEDGSELLALETGVEGRIWRAGDLIASRWWPESPSLEDWREFLRGGGLKSLDTATVPSPMTFPLKAKPWGARDGFRPGALSFGGMEAHLPTAMLALAGLAGTIASAQIGSIARSHVDIWRAEREAQRMDDGIKRVLAAREAADRHLTAANALLGLRTSRPATALIAEAARVLPDSGWSIRHWQQPSPDRLELTLIMPDADPQEVVAAWEASPVFDNVAADILGRSGEVVIRASIPPAETMK